MAQRRPWTVWMLLIILVCKMYDGEATSSTTTTTPPVSPTPPSVTVTTQSTTSITFSITVQEGACVIVNWNGDTLTNNTECVTANASYTTIGVLTPGTCYNFTMAAKRNGLISTVKTNSACTVPSSPVNVMATTQTTTSIALNIVKGDGNVQCYIISTSLIDSANRTCTVNTTEESSTNTPYTYPELGPGQGHTFQVRAMYTNMTSDVFNSTVMYTAPSDPSAEVTAQTTNNISLDITAGTGGVPDYYIVQTSLPGSNRVNVANGNGNISTTITGLASGTCYTANIEAGKGNVNSSAIPVQGNVCTVPSSPVTVTAITQTTTRVTLNITKGIGNVDCYIISNSSTDAATKTCTVNTSEESSPYTTYNYTGLGPGQDHTFYVRAKYKDLNSVESNPTVIYTVPSAPNNVQVLDQTTNSIQLSITEGTGNVDYYVITCQSNTDVNPCNGPKNTTSVGGDIGTTYNYTGLNAGHVYTFNIVAKYQTLTSSALPSGEMFTVPSAPAGVVTITQTTTSIQLKITKGTGNMDYYIISTSPIQDGDTSYNVTVNQTSEETRNFTTYNYTGLDPGQNYTFHVKAKYNDLTSVGLTSASQMYTVPSTPAGVVNITQTTTSIQLNITNGTGNVDCYITSTSPIQDGDTFCNVTVTSEGGTTYTAYNYTDLNPGRNYTFYVKAKYKNLTSDVLTSSEMYTVPSTPSSVEATSQTSTSVTLRITQEDGHVDCYIIRTNQIQERDTNCSEPATVTPGGNTTYTTYTYTRLIPGQGYTFYVKAKYNNLISGVATSDETNTVPSNLTNLAVAERTTNSLSVSWSNSGGNKKVVYNVTCVSPNKDKADITLSNTTQLTSFDIPRLTPGSQCVVNITPQAGHQLGTSLTETFYNLETAPSPVTNPQIVSVTSRSMYVRWGKPDNSSGVIRQYVVIVTEEKKEQPQTTLTFCCSNCSNINPDLYGCDQPSSENFTDCSGNSNINFISSDTTIDYNITGLHPYRNYSIQVIPYTLCAGEAITITNQTHEDKQEAAPSDLSVDNYQFKAETWEITLTWLAPSDRNGIIVNYTVEFNYLNDSICYNSIPRDQQYATRTEVTQETGLTLNYKLRSDWTYSFKVTAATSLGAGNFSMMIPFHTPTSTPGSIATASVVPSDVSNSSVVLSWDVPCRPNGPISNYIITWQSRLSPDTATQSCSDNGTFTTTSNNTHMQLTPLLSSRNYIFYVAAESLYNGTGDTTQGTTNTTSVANPYQPDITMVTAINATSVNVSWSPVTCPLYTGPTNFTVTGTNAGPDNVNVTTRNATCEGYKSTSCIVTELEEYWEYNFTVTATTNTGNTTSVSSKKRTEESPPGEVQQFKVISEQDVTLPRSIHVTWDQPLLLERNGVIQHYTVQYINNDQATGTKTVNEPTPTPSVTFEDIAPGNYTITIFATNNADDGLETSDTTTLLPGAPLKPSETDGDLLVKKDTTTSNTEKTVAVQLPLDEFLCNYSNGPIQLRGVVVAEATEANDEPYARTKKEYEENLSTKYKTWSAVKDMDPIPPYIATPDGWNPCGTVSGSGRRKRRAVGTDSQPVFVVGKDGEDCESGTRCNGALPDGRTFKVKIYACTDQGCTETMYSLSLTTEIVPVTPKETNIVLPAVLGTVAALIVVAAVGIAVFVLRRKQALCFGKDEEGGRKRSIEVELVIKTHPVNLSEFPEYTDGLFKDSRLKFSEQYNDIKDFSPAFPINVAESQPCRSKNRYTNIMPFDKTRVRLLPLDDVDGSDFINANYIPGYNSQREYIATQGPLPSTKDDFWRMVWEQNVEVIVMLTKCMETGRIKCDQYWPDLNEPVYYGDLIVAVQSESVLADYVIRIIEVKLVNEVRQIRQLCFLSWPDMGCPDQPIKLLDFVKTVRQNMGPNCKDKPLLVHCSAGVGRTGTFIAVDHLLKYIREHDEVDIFKLVLDMRNHRCNMVQTEDQYVYIHECLREFITDDDEEEEEEEEEHLYANSNYGENVYENTAFSAL